MESLEQAGRQLDDSICAVCNLCGDLRVESDHEDFDDQELKQVARLVQQELRYLRQGYQGLKVAVDKVLDDHEQRIRQLEFRIWFAIGGGAVLGWLGSVLLRAGAK